MVILDLLLQGNSVLSQSSELFIWDQHWQKWLLLCQWYALCSPKMIVFGLFICTLWLVKTKLACFYNVDSNVVVRNETRVACLNKPRLLGTKTPVYSKVFQKTVCEHCRFRIFEMTDIHFWKSASYLIECTGFYLFSFQLFAKFFSFHSWIQFLMIPMHAHSLLSSSENREIHFILFILYFILFLYLPSRIPETEDTSFSKQII